MTAPNPPRPLGRRDRNMREKRERIFQAAEALFEERGFDGVTTQAISNLADIGAGTLFRYAASKNELLLLVYNEKFRGALEVGAERAGRARNATDAVVEMIAPLMELARTSSENGMIYQRELLFGSPNETHRLEGLAIIADLERAIATRLCSQATRDGLSVDENAARLASSSIFAATHLAIARRSTAAHPDHDAMTDLRGQITQIVSGFFGRS